MHADSGIFDEVAQHLLGGPQRFVGLLALGDILKAIDRADDVAIAVLEGFDVDERDAAHAARPLDMDFLLAQGNAGTQHLGHRAFMVRQQAAVGPEHFIGAAIPFVGIAKLGRPAPQFGGAAVIAKHQPLAVANIDGERHLFEQPRRQCEGIVLFAQINVGAGRLGECANVDRGWLAFPPGEIWWIGGYATHCVTSVLLKAIKRNSANSISASWFRCIGTEGSRKKVIHGLVDRPQYQNSRMPAPHIGQSGVAIELKCGTTGW